jgi:predicted amidohydrolase YtcJ
MVGIVPAALAAPRQGTETQSTYVVVYAQNVSINAARAVGLEEEIGTVEVGKMADFVVVEETFDTRPGRSF